MFDRKTVVNAVAQPLAIIMGQHVRVGIEDNIWSSKRERMTTVQQIEAAVGLCERFGRKVATPSISTTR